MFFMAKRKQQNIPHFMFARRILTAISLSTDWIPLQLYLLNSGEPVPESVWWMPR
jgi:hypothetical protein